MKRKTKEIKQVRINNRILQILGLANNFKKSRFSVVLDGHSNLVTPVPIPNTEVKLFTFVSVLSLMGKHEAVLFYSLMICDYYLLTPVLNLRTRKVKLF